MDPHRKTPMSLVQTRHGAAGGINSQVAYNMMGAVVEQRLQEAAEAKTEE